MGSIRLWSIHNRTCIKELSESTSPVWSMSLSADRKMLAVGSLDSMIRIWNIETGECMKRFCMEKIYEGMNITGVKGLSAAEIATLKALGAVEESVKEEG